MDRVEGAACQPLKEHKRPVKVGLTRPVLTVQHGIGRFHTFAVYQDIPACESGLKPLEGIEKFNIRPNQSDEVLNFLRN